MKQLMPVLAASIAVMLGGCGESQIRNGAWFGDIKLCADNVDTYRRTVDRQSQLPVLRVRFTAAAAKELESMSRKFVGEPVPLQVNGTELVAPTLVEPLTEGKVELLGVAPDRLVDVIAYMERPC